MTQVEFLAGGNSIDQAIDFTCDLVGEFFISEKKEILSDSRIHIRCESTLNANKVNDKMWTKPKELIIPHNIIGKNEDHLPVQISYPGLKIDSSLFVTLINLNPDLPSDFLNYKDFFQIVIEDGDKLRERAAQSWKKCLDLNLKPQFKNANG